MTAGALLQLKYGLADRMAFLTFNPSISHFKSVYKKYTSFSMETIGILPSRNAVINFDNETTIEFKITRDADLVKDLFITFEFPDIYSPNATDVGSHAEFNGYHSFRWIKRLAEYIVKDVNIRMDAIEIDKHYSEWFHIHSEMTIPAEKKAGYYEMIGNIPEYYDPENGAGCGGIYPSGFTVSNVPSIVGRRVILPLRFWFNNNASASFPLIATQRLEFFITVNLRSLKDLYILMDNSGQIIKPGTNTPNIGQFLKNQSSDKNLNITMNLEANYIFLEREERKRFALASHEYLINQVQRVSPTSVNDFAYYTFN
jgi:hypothetical protein